MLVAQVADGHVSETEALALRVKEVLGRCDKMEAFGIAPDETLPIQVVSLRLHATAFTTAQSHFEVVQPRRERDEEFAGIDPAFRHATRFVIGARQIPDMFNIPIAKVNAPLRESLMVRFLDGQPEGRHF